MVGVDSGSLQADSQPKSFGLVWGSAAAWRRSTFMKWTGWTLAIAVPWWQHHKHQYALLLLLLLLLLLSKYLNIIIDILRVCHIRAAERFVGDSYNYIFGVINDNIIVCESVSKSSVETVDSRVTSAFTEITSCKYCSGLFVGPCVGHCYAQLLQSHCDSYLKLTTERLHLLERVLYELTYRAPRTVIEQHVYPDACVRSHGGRYDPTNESDS